MNKIAILGAGAFGFAMAKLLSENHYDKEISLFDIQEKFINHINATREHPVFHENTKLPEHVKATTELQEAVKDADMILLAIPSKYVRHSLKDFKQFLTKDVVFLNMAKGLESETNMMVSQVIDEEMKGVAVNYNICHLSGGMIAREVTLGHPLCADLACEDRVLAKQIARMLWSDNLRIETTDDLIGAELSGAFKNVIAVGAGIFDGMGYGESSKSAFVSAAAKQVRELAKAMGAKPETFGPGSQTWFGDLMTTCFGKSRNRELGELIGKGVDVQEAVRTQITHNKSLEGYITAEVVYNLVRKHQVDAPLLVAVYRVLHKGYKPEEFVRDFIKAW